MRGLRGSSEQHARRENFSQPADQSSSHSESSAAVRTFSTEVTSTMRTTTAALLIACSLSLFISAPANAQKEVTVPRAKADLNVYGAYPIAYREILQRWMSPRLVTPNTAQFEFPSPPQAGQYTTENGKRYIGYIVEFTVRAQNRFGSYTKEKYRAVIFAGNVLWVGR